MPMPQSTSLASAYVTMPTIVPGATSASESPCASVCEYANTIDKNGTANSAPPTEKRPDKIPPSAPTTPVQPHASRGVAAGSSPRARSVGDADQSARTAAHDAN